MKAWSVVLLAMVGVWTAERVISPCSNGDRIQGTRASSGSCPFSGTLVSGEQEAGCSAVEVAQAQACGLADAEASEGSDSSEKGKSLACCETYTKVKLLAKAEPECCELCETDEEPLAKAEPECCELCEADESAAKPEPE